MSNIITDKCGIYIFTNKINGKQYVGKDITLYKNQRKNHHFTDAYNPNRPDYNGKFHRAIRKYGKENWDYRRVFCDADDIKDTEIHYIALLESFGKGYNMTPGGDGWTLGMKLTEEHKKKIGDGNRGKKVSDKARENMSKAQQGKKFSKERRAKHNKHLIGIPRTDETKRKISETKKKTKAWNWKGGNDRLCNVCNLEKVYVNPNNNKAAPYCRKCGSKIRKENDRKAKLKKMTIL